MKSYITCPVCGTKFGKAEEVKDLDLQCPRCRENLIVNVTSGGVAVHKAECAEKGRAYINKHKRSSFVLIYKFYN